MSKWRIAEIFGPTIQGEGRNVGVQCCFVRFGGCDFRCEWCDTPFAVLPEFVNELPKMDEWGVIAALNALGDKASISPTWVVLSGGNPGLLNLKLLIDLLHKRSQKVMVETQGSTYRDWYVEVDDLCFSPKPPSSGMRWDFGLFQRILGRMNIDLTEKTLKGEAHPPLPYLKVPIFSQQDLDFAEDVRAEWPMLEMYLSIGNVDPALPTVKYPHPSSDPRDHAPLGLQPTYEAVLESYRFWVAEIMERQALDGVHIFPQQHVLLWGNERGR